MISQDHLKNTCRFGQGEKCCIFLMFSARKFECAKGTNLEEHLRQRLLAGTTSAKGDNCSGWHEVMTKTSRGD